MRQRTIDEATARKLAVKAAVDPRSVKKVLRGETVRGDAGRRAAEALAEMGLLPLRVA